MNSHHNNEICFKPDKSLLWFGVTVICILGIIQAYCVIKKEVLAAIALSWGPVGGILFIKMWARFRLVLGSDLDLRSKRVRRKQHPRNKPEGIRTAVVPLGLLGSNWEAEIRNAKQKHKPKPSQDSPEKYNLKTAFRGPTHGVKLSLTLMIKRYLPDIDEGTQNFMKMRKIGFHTIVLSVATSIFVLCGCQGRYVDPVTYFPMDRAEYYDDWIGLGDNQVVYYLGLADLGKGVLRLKGEYSVYTNSISEWGVVDRHLEIHFKHQGSMEPALLTCSPGTGVLVGVISGESGSRKPVRFYRKRFLKEILDQYFTEAVQE